MGRIYPIHWLMMPDGAGYLRLIISHTVMIMSIWVRYRLPTRVPSHTHFVFPWIMETPGPLQTLIAIIMEYKSTNLELPRLISEQVLQCRCPGPSGCLVRGCLGLQDLEQKLPPANYANAT